MTGKIIQAYAKILGHGWEYYMTKPKIVLGRGGNQIPCDVVLCTDSAVSRRHFSIRFAPEHHAIEVENLSKNGILINNDFVCRDSPPVLLTSQAEIAYGKDDSMRVTLMFPAPTRAQIEKPPQTMFLPLLQWIGQILVVEGCMPPHAIMKKLRVSRSQELANIDDYALRNSIRHVLSQNLHIFRVVSSHTDDSICASGASPPRDVFGYNEDGIYEPDYDVHPDEHERFFQFAQNDHHNSEPVLTTVN